MEDGAQGVRGGDRGESCGQVLARGRVPGREPHLGPGTRELRRELGRTCGTFTATAQEQQLPGSVPGHEVPGEQPAQPTGPAGDQDRATAVVVSVRRGLDSAAPDHSGSQQVSVTQGELRFSVRRLRQGGEVRLVPVHVRQGEPARVLRLRRPDQPPDGGRPGIGEGIAHRGRHRTTSEEQEPRIGEAVLVQPLPYQLQSVRGRTASRRNAHGDDGGHGRVRREVPERVDVHGPRPGRGVMGDGCPVDAMEDGGGATGRAQRRRLDR